MSFFKRLRVAGAALSIDFQQLLKSLKIFAKTFFRVPLALISAKASEELEREMLLKHLIVEMFKGEQWDE